MRRINQDPVAVAAKLRKVSGLRPSLALVLGSGLSPLARLVETEAEIDYRNLPGFPAPTVSGHAGKLLIGRLGGTPVIVACGRAHFYEGHDFHQVTFPIRVLAHYPITDLLLTNAAGAVNRHFRIGDLMILEDHINLMGANPLRGKPPENGLTRFVDLTSAYDLGLRRLLQSAGRASGVELRTGVYLAVGGPSYETPAEIRAFSRLGADAVGMSTVPEVIVARQCGLRVAGLSCITNLAAGLGGKVVSHEEVLETAARCGDQSSKLLMAFAELYQSAISAEIGDRPPDSH